MDIDLPSDCLKYDEYADSEFLVHFSDVNDNEYWKHRLQLKFGYKQLTVLNGTFRQQFINYGWKRYKKIKNILIKNDIWNIEI